MTNVASPSSGPITDPSPPSDRIGLAVDGSLEVLLVASIDWLEAHGNHVRVHAGGAVRLVRTTLAAPCARLGTTMFIRVHRGIVVNVTRVAAVRAAANGDRILVLTTGHELRMSRRYRHSLLALFR